MNAATPEERAYSLQTRGCLHGKGQYGSQCDECIANEIRAAVEAALQEDRQRLSFAYGNTKLSNSDVTPEMVATAAIVKDAVEAARREGRAACQYDCICGYKAMPPLCTKCGRPTSKRLDEERRRVFEATREVCVRLAYSPDRTRIGGRIRELTMEEVLGDE